MYPRCFEVTPRLIVRHLRVGRLPGLKLASNLLSLRMSPPGKLGNDRLFVWDCICPTSSSPSPLFLSQSQLSSPSL